jgi:uncharacterized protein (TIGR01319 family)
LSTSNYLCLDIGSTFTKAALVSDDGELLGVRETPTSVHPDVLDGCRFLAAQLGAGPDTHTLACSSAGGGLRLGVVGYERQVTAEAGYRVGLSAGAKVVHVAARSLDHAAVQALDRSEPDLVLLVGGTDGGNADVLRHNASRLAEATLGRPVVVAGNVDVRDEVAAMLREAGQPVVLADNVVPEIGVLAPESARAAIRAAFLEHVIGGKGLSADPSFRQQVRAPTPDAVLRGVEELASLVDGDVLVVDVGGATTDVYSSLSSLGTEDAPRAEVVAPLPDCRTVEGDLGVRWNAISIVEAASRERLPVSSELPAYASAVAANPTHLPGGPGEARLDLQLATIAAVAAIRRHGRSSSAGQPPRPLGDVALVLASGGVLRHADRRSVRTLLDAITGDHGGGWRVPRSAQTGVDQAYVLFAVGLLAEDHPRAARALATRLLDRQRNVHPGRSHMVVTRK